MIFWNTSLKKKSEIKSNTVKFVQHTNKKICSMQAMSFFCENLQYAVDANSADRTLPAETDGVHVENILLSMWNIDADKPTKSANTKQNTQARNRVSVKESRDADRMFVELLLVELNDITDTFEGYATYIGQVKCHVPDAECSRDLELRCLAHKENIQKLQTPEVRTSMQTLFGKTRLERNRIHAGTSRRRKSQLIHDVIRERDASLITLQELRQYTTTLESSCSVLNDFDETGDAFMQLAQARQRLFQLSCTHTQQQKTLTSRLSFRQFYRLNFR